VELLLQSIGDGKDGVAIGHSERAAGDEVVLQIHENERAAAHFSLRGTNGLGRTARLTLTRTADPGGGGCPCLAPMPANFGRGGIVTSGLGCSAAGGGGG